jgi:hypothetical protein
MAKVIIEVDTDEATLNVTVNGEAVDNVSSASAYLYKDMYGGKNGPQPEVNVHISTETKDDSGVTIMTHICAEDASDGRTAKALGAPLSAIAGFVINPVAKEQEEKYAEGVQGVRKHFEALFVKKRG